MERPKVGVGVVVIKDGKVLFLKRIGAHGEGTWCYPGGHLEFKESPFDAAIREVMEETGLHVNNPRFLCITNDIFQEEKHYITIFVAVDYAGGEARIMEPDRSTEIGWFSFGNFPRQLFLPVENMVSGNCFPKDWREKISGMDQI